MLAKALVTESDVQYNSAKESVRKRITERELQFIRLVCSDEEYTYENIAHLMEVSRRTVDGYRTAVFEKFGIKSKTGLVLFAIRNELIEIPA
ncbi:MAG: response regulator transcription factor [Sphingobacteriales bacterium]|nr:MAG: response regulator transcription factor [Sphingobacteriales bacterium]